MSEDMNPDTPQMWELPPPPPEPEPEVSGRRETLSAPAPDLSTKRSLGTLAHKEGAAPLPPKRSLGVFPATTKESSSAAKKGILSAKKRLGVVPEEVPELPV